VAIDAGRRDPGPAGPPELDGVFQSVEAYYTGKVTEHGATPLGVDWSCQATQWLRFVQLLKLCAFDKAVSLNDLGCGYGELATFLHQRYPRASIDYLGIDLSPVMVQRARRRHRGDPATRFAVGRTCRRRADYSVASGIMNVMLGFPVALWEDFVRGILVDMHRNSLRGFAVNFCESRRPDLRPDELYCSAPDPWIRYCEAELGCSVEVVCNYGLREFTLLAYRESMFLSRMDCADSVILTDAVTA
jgi:SAM-dependent methyltransferase